MLLSLALHVVYFSFKRKISYTYVILTDDVEAVGKKGATMKVRAGFYRKLLLPKGKPTLLTPEVLK